MKWVNLCLSLIWLWFLPATLAAGVIVGIVAVTGGQWPWYAWIFAGPFLYSLWLISFLFFCGPMIGRMGRRHPKPRRATMPGRDRGLITVAACSLRLNLVSSLPLVPMIRHTAWGRNLVMRSYSPSFHIGKKAIVMGRLTDPDLTTIGEYATVGLDATITAHLWLILPSGKREYLTAPVKIGKHALIGGGAGVMPGCNIGEYAIIQPGSLVQPYTAVPAGEIWGGNPASFQAKRNGIRKDPKTTPIKEEQDVDVTA